MLDVDTLSSTRSARDFLRGLSSLFVHKTPASALAPSKSTSRALSEPSLTSSIKKRKKKEDPLIVTETDAGSRWSPKKSKLGSHAGSDVRLTPVAEKKKPKGINNPTSEAVKTKDVSKEKKRKDEQGKKKQAAKPTVSGNEGEGEAVEASKRGQLPFASEGEDSECIPPAHESLAGTSRPDSTSPSKKSKKYVPPDETSDQRDSRTIFVGNVPLQVMTTKVG